MLISRLGEYARAPAGRTRPIEITLSPAQPARPLTADDVRRMAELGVDRTLRRASGPKALEGLRAGALPRRKSSTRSSAVGCD